MRRKCTLVRMTSEHSKRVQERRIYKKRNTKKILEDRKERQEEWQGGWK